MPPCSTAGPATALALPYSEDLHLARAIWEQANQARRPSSPPTLQPTAVHTAGWGAVGGFVLPPAGAVTSLAESRRSGFRI